jgi:RTX calcium-binding nonapeptide repeat (4 copies)
MVAAWGRTYGPSMNPALPILLAMFAFASPAAAATVTWTPPPPQNAASPEESCSRYALCPPGQLVVRAARGERNDISFEKRSTTGHTVVRDAGARLEATAPCEAAADGSVSCPTDWSTEVTVFAEDGDDRVITPYAEVFGGEGDDVLTAEVVDGGAGDDTIEGTDDFDRLTGGEGRDTVRGLGGNDVIVDHVLPDADTLLDGGPGLDTISFEARAFPVFVDLDPNAMRASSAGEQQALAGFENAMGGEASDEIYGSPVRQPGTLGGAPIALHGRGGHDRIVLRSPGYVVGGNQNDVIVGSSGADTIFAGRGDDTVHAGAGRDYVAGEAGADVIVTRDRSRDRVDCGTDRDRVVADRRDTTRGCEHPRRR